MVSSEVYEWVGALRKAKCNTAEHLCPQCTWAHTGSSNYGYCHHIAWDIPGCAKSGLCKAPLRATVPPSSQQLLTVLLPEKGLRGSSQLQGRQATAGQYSCDFGSVAIYFFILTLLVLTSHAHFEHHLKQRSLCSAASDNLLFSTTGTKLSSCL